VRQDFLRRLLRTQRQITQNGPLPDYELITKAELEEIRTQWRCDPNEPDWEDTLPRIYREEMGRNLDWNKHDDARFDGEDSRLIADAAKEFGLPPELVMKLLEFEISMEGLSKRSQIFARLSNILQKDWGELQEQVRTRSEQGTQLRDREEQEQKLFERYATLQKMIADAT
jgi:DNA sulfur modification protein DndC